MIEIDVYFHRSLEFVMQVGSMSTVNQVTLVQGDTSPKLKFVMKSCDGGVINGVSGCGVSGVNFYLKRNCSNNTINCGHTACTPIDPENGVWGYCFAEGDLENFGTHFGDLEIVYDNGKTETGFEPIRFYVRESNKRC